MDKIELFLHRNKDRWVAALVHKGGNACSYSVPRELIDNLIEQLEKHPIIQRMSASNQPSAQGSGRG